MVKPSQDAVPHRLPSGTLIDGRYRVVRFIGQGGAGLVHEVEHVLTGRRLAMKTLLHEAGYARLTQEAKATSMMKNTHTVKITDMGTASGVAAGTYMIMELLEGQSLRARLEEAGQLPIDLTVNIALQVCECLAEAHARGIIHRDIKPENVILAASPWPGQYDVKVLDFGVVKILVDALIPHTSLTRTGLTVGTPYYMSLEQLRDSSSVDARADIYALGVVLYECLSGRKPFEADTIADIVFALCSGPPTHLSKLRPEIPAEVCEVVMQALSMEREERQNNMEEIATALLPFGNPAFGLWISPEARQKKAAASPARAIEEAGPKDAGAPRPSPEAPEAGEPGRPAPTESITGEPSESITAPRVPATIPLTDSSSTLVARSPSAEAPEEPTAAQHLEIEDPPTESGSTLVARAPSADASQGPVSSRRLAIAGPPVESSSVVIPRPLIDEDLDDQGRDTPTEMYAQGHPPRTIRSATGDRDTPTRPFDPRLGLDPRDGGYAQPLPTPGADIDAGYGQLVVNPVSPMPPARGPGPRFTPVQETLQFALTSLTSGAPPDKPAPLRAQVPATPQPHNRLAPQAEPPPRPLWQRFLDWALVRVGDAIELVASAAVTPFREASPRMQLGIAVGGAFLLSATLVLLLYYVMLR